MHCDGVVFTPINHPAARAFTISQSGSHFHWAMDTLVTVVAEACMELCFEQGPSGMRPMECTHFDLHACGCFCAHYFCERVLAEVEFGAVVAFSASVFIIGNGGHVVLCICTDFSYADWMAGTSVLTSHRLTAQRYTFGYGEPIPVEQLVQSLCDTKQVRPAFS